MNSTGEFKNKRSDHNSSSCRARGIALIDPSRRNALDPAPNLGNAHCRLQRGLDRPIVVATLIRLEPPEYGSFRSLRRDCFCQQRHDQARGRSADEQTT